MGEESMKIYASFQMIRLDPITKEEEVLYEEFIKRMEPYRKREIEYMIFYQIEITKPLKLCPVSVVQLCQLLFLLIHRLPPFCSACPVAAYPSRYLHNIRHLSCRK